MSIFRVKKNANYVVMNRTALNDTRLSWKAKGIIAYMLSMPDDWTFYIEELTSHSSDGEKAFRSGLKELKDTGYVKREPVREGNRIVRWETVVSEIPLDNSLLADFVQVENVQVQSVHVQKEGLLSIDSKINIEDTIPFTDMDIPFFEIVKHLNDKTDSKYKHTSKKTKNLIKARWNEGYTLEDFKTVIDKKSSEWLYDSKMIKFLRPETLFGNKFESYLNQKSAGPDFEKPKPTGRAIPDDINLDFSAGEDW